MANFFSQGEVCLNGTRVFVHKSIYEEFVDKVVARTKGIKVGDPTDPSVGMGALISQEHLQKVLSYVEKGEKEGAVLACGGRRKVAGLSDEFSKGNFMEPAVFVGCTDDMEIVKQEIFGPVMTILSFEDEDEVLQRANASELGLAAGVFTSDIKRAHRMAQNLQAGKRPPLYSFYTERLGDISLFLHGGNETA